VLPPP